MSTTNAFNPQSQDPTTGKQQQPGYPEQAPNQVSNAAPTANTMAGNANNSTAGTTDPSANYRNQQPNVGGGGDMGAKHDADATRLPEDRANPSDTQFRNQQEHVGGAGNVGARGDTDVSRLPEDRANPDPHSSNTMHDPTQHGHSGGVTGPNVVTDRGPGMPPHREDIQRGNREGGPIGQQNWAGAVDFQPGRDAGHNADTRDPGMNERTQAPVGGVDTTSSTRRGDQHHDAGVTGQQNLAGATNFQPGRDAGYTTGTRDHGMNERAQAPAGVAGVIDPTTSTRRGDMHRDAGAPGHQNLAGATNFQPGRDAGHTAGTRDHGVAERTQAPVGGVDPTTSTHRGGRDATQEGPTGESQPTKLEKLHGKVMVTKGQLTKDEEAIYQGKRLQTEGMPVHPSPYDNERRE